MMKKKAMAWTDGQPHMNRVRSAGVEQFISILQDPRPLPTELLFVDKVEYTIASFDEASSSVAPSLRADEILAQLNEISSDSSMLHPKYSNYTIQATPVVPFRGIAQLTKVERSMIARRARVSTALRANERLLTLTAFPNLGAMSPQPEDGADVSANPIQRHRSSALLPWNKIISPHSRFLTMTRNIRERRGEPLDIRAPVLQDTHTTAQSVHMDHQAFGMQSCLQVTLQMPSLRAARRVHDQMAAIAPVLLSLTAATPILKGMLIDTDAKWNYSGMSVDDRTAAERGVSTAKTQPNPCMAGGGTTRLRHSRCSSIQAYISRADGSANDPTRLNDAPVVTDPDALSRLLAAGVDSTLAQHVAMLFSRDPLVVDQECLANPVAMQCGGCRVNSSNEHFENLNSTTWQTVRLNPPPPGQNIVGWRVEVRSCEVSLTDFENAAWTAFAVLLANAAASDSAPDWRVPISSLNANMEVAHQRSAVCEEQMAWNVRGKLQSATVDEIVNSEAGLLSVARGELERSGLCGAEAVQLESYLAWVSKVASGTVDTTAGWVRKMVMQHPEYCHDSVVSEQICLDLLKECARVTEAGPQAREHLMTSVTRGVHKRSRSEQCSEACSVVKQQATVTHHEATGLDTPTRNRLAIDRWDPIARAVLNETAVLSTSERVIATC